MIPVVLISGYSNSGKTTVIQEIIKALKIKEYKVATVKHHHSGKIKIQEGTDSSKHLIAGADITVVSSDENYLRIENLKKEKSLADIISEINDVDLILVEGYKKENFPKIEVYRSELKNDRLNNEKGNIIGVVSDIEISDENIPSFRFNQIDKLTDFIEKNFLK